MANCPAGGHFSFCVKGVSYERRWKVIDRYVHVNDLLYLVREPDNPYGKSAILVRTAEGFDIGYVPHEDSLEIAPLLDLGYSHRAFCYKIIGYKYSVPVVIADIRHPLRAPKSWAKTAIPPNAIPPTDKVLNDTVMVTAVILILSAALGAVLLYLR